MYKPQTIKFFGSPKAKRIYQQHCVLGGATSVVLNGETVSAQDLEAFYGGVEPKQINTDIQEESHEGMGELEPSGDHEDSGDGDSQEQE